MPKIEKDLLKVKGSDGQWHYIPAVGGGDTPTWGAVQNKPFSTLGSGLEVDENGVLSAKGGTGGSPNAVQYVKQELTDEQKTQARENIGAGTSSFSGSYNDLANRPTIPTQVTIDSTLKQSGQAADAKAVGDALQNYVSEDVFEGVLSGISQAINKKLDKNQGTTNAGKILGVGEDGNVIPQDKPTYTLPQATADALGGIKADAATAEDTQPVRIGADGKLKTKPTSGSNVTVDSELSSTSENPVQNKIVTAALAEKITAPATASVGQIIKVKSVDTSGKPTEWEAADLPSGDKWELIASGTVAEDASLTVNKDSNGKAFELKSCQVVITGSVTGIASTYMRFSVSGENNYHSVEMPLKKENPTIKAVYYCIDGEVPMLFWKQDVGTTAWASNENSCQFGLHGNQSYVLDILQHHITSIYIGNYMGTGKLAAGTKYEIYGVRA